MTPVWRFLGSFTWFLAPPLISRDWGANDHLGSGPSGCSLEQALHGRSQYTRTQAPSGRAIGPQEEEEMEEAEDHSEEKKIWGELGIFFQQRKQWLLAQTRYTAWQYSHSAYTHPATCVVISRSAVTANVNAMLCKQYHTVVFQELQQSSDYNSLKGFWFEISWVYGFRTQSYEGLSVLGIRHYSCLPGAGSKQLVKTRRGR